MSPNLSETENILTTYETHQSFDSLDLHLWSCFLKRWTMQYFGFKTNHKKETKHVSFFLNKKANQKKQTKTIVSICFNETYHKNKTKSSSAPFSPALQDEQLFRTEEVTSTGQALGIVVAETLEEREKNRGFCRWNWQHLPTVG